MAHPKTTTSATGKQVYITTTQSMPPVTEQEDFFDDGWPGYEELVFSID